MLASCKITPSLKMKILYINTLYSPYIEGGAEISLKLIVEGMKSLGNQVAVLCLFPGKGMEEDEVNGVKVYRAGLQNFYWPYHKKRQGKALRFAWHLRDRYNPSMMREVAKVLEKEKPDVVSCHNLAGWSVGVWDEIYNRKIPIVQVLHDMYLLCANSNMFKGDLPCNNQCLRCRILRYTHKEKSTKVSAVVGISKSILTKFTDFGYFPNASKYVIHNTRSIPLPPAKKKRGKGDVLKIGYLGTLSKIKGIEWLIEQFQSLDINATLVIAGKGKKDYEEKLKSLAHHKNITFLGYVKSSDFYPLIDVLVVPSLWEEPLGMVAIEGLANNLPVIANNSGGLKETVIDGKNGILCHASTPDTLGEAIKRLYHGVDFYNELAALARPSVSEILSRERMIEQYGSVMEAIQNTKSS